MVEILKTFDLTPLDAAMILATIPLFLIVWWALRVYLFVPFVALCEARESATEGKRALALAREAELQSVEGDIELRLRDARIAGNLQRTQRIEDARRKAEAIVAKAEEAGQEHVRNSRWELLQQFDDVRRQTLAEAAPLANDLIRRIFPQGVA